MTKKRFFPALVLALSLTSAGALAELSFNG